MFFDRILNLEEASQVAGLSASRLRWLAERGRFPSARRIGKGWAVLESDVRDFLERERRPGKPWLLRGNWLFQRLPADRQHWLVYRSKSLLCEPTGEGFDLAFIGETLAEVDPDGMLDPAAYPGVAMPELSSANRWVNLVGRGVAVIGLVNGAWQRVPVISRDLAAGWIEVQWPAMDYAIGPGRTVPLDVPRLRLGPDQYQEITTA